MDKIMENVASSVVNPRFYSRFCTIWMEITKMEDEQERNKPRKAEINLNEKCGAQCSKS